MPTTIQVSDHTRRRLRVLQEGTGKSCDKIIREALEEHLGVLGSLAERSASPASNGKSVMGDLSPALPTQAELDALDDILNFVVDHFQWQPGHDDEEKELLNKVELVNALMTKVERLKDKIGVQVEASDEEK